MSDDTRIQALVLAGVLQEMLNRSTGADICLDPATVHEAVRVLNAAAARIEADERCLAEAERHLIDALS